MVAGLEEANDRLNMKVKRTTCPHARLGSVGPVVCGRWL